MEMVTVKRNGVFISFPQLITREKGTREDVIAGTLVLTLPREKKESQKIIVQNKVRTSFNGGHVQQKSHSIIKLKTGKKCMKCGEDCWRTDVNYCWDCYKYENFESK